MRLGVYGGSFNPPHLGHLRLALEMREALGLDRVDLVPVAAPPHKLKSGLLPYAVRRRMLATSVRHVSGLEVSELEAVLAEPSYTSRTLAAYRLIVPNAELHFLLGVGDLLEMPKWHRGLELPTLTNLAVAPRAQQGEAEVAEFVHAHWPRAVRDDLDLPAGRHASWKFAQDDGRRETRLTLVPVTRLDISATDIRRRFLAGKSIAFLLPREALRMLEEHAAQAWECWGNGGVCF